MSAPVLCVSELNVQAGKFSLKDISFSLDKDGYLIILGPTGCGKTVLLETLAGLREPISGEILLKDSDITARPPETRGLGFAYQDSLLYPFLNVKENILFGAKAQRRHKEAGIFERLYMLAEVMGISHLLGRLPSALSGGEKQRVSLARAILTSPPVLLLDEPLSALDPQTRDSMRALLQEIHRTEGMGIIHVTRDFNEALQLGTKVLVMNKGEIIQQGDPLFIFEKPDTLFVAEFLQSENIVKGRIEKENGAYMFKSSEDGWVFGPLPKDKCLRGISNEVCLVLHSGQIEVSSINKPSFKDKNSWDALVESVTVNNSYVKLTCRGKGCWHASLSRREWQELLAKAGTKVRLSVKGENIHIIGDS